MSLYGIKIADLEIRNETLNFEACKMQSKVESIPDGVQKGNAYLL